MTGDRSGVPTRAPEFFAALRALSLEREQPEAHAWPETCETGPSLENFMYEVGAAREIIAPDRTTG